MESQGLSKPVVLIGMMGTGKSFLGARLARAFNVSFIDTDTVIEKTQSSSIAEIFSIQGENYFRDLEFQTIKSSLEQKNSVIAVGGGAYTFQRNQEIIDTIGISVWLEASAEILWQRIKGNDKRPLLKQANSLLKLRELLEIREKDYARAQLRFRTDTELSINNLVMMMKDQISEHQLRNEQ